MCKQTNRNLLNALELSQKLLLLADEGDRYRLDVGCGVLFGTIRDCAYKIRLLAEAEIENHKNMGIWMEPRKKIET
jgi:hypothetical protein